MPTLLQAALLGLLQGATELFPVSSLGHSVVLPALLGWNLSQSDSAFVAFVVYTHLATALVLLGFFWNDWIRIVGGMLRSLKQREIKNEDVYAKLGWLIVVATIPAGILGLLFEDGLQALFANATLVAFVLMLNGVLLLAIDVLNRRKKIDIDISSRGVGREDERASRLSWGKSLVVGGMQCLALIPGFSRTGSSLAGGLIADLDYAAAARFSFLLATPIIFAAAVLKLPDALALGPAMFAPAAVGMACAGIAAYISVRFLTKYFETKTLWPFAVYCLMAGAASLAWLHFAR